MIIVFGNLSYEHLLLVDQFPSKNQDVLVSAAAIIPGGAAGNVADGLAIQGENVALAACVGNDEKGRNLLNSLNAQRVGTRLCQISHEATSEFYVIMTSDGDRSFLLDEKSASFQLFFSREHRKALLKASGLALVGAKISVCTEAAELAQEISIPTYVNVGFWLAARDSLDEILYIADIAELVFLNREEFAMLETSAKRQLLKKPRSPKKRQVIITDGANATQIWRGGKSFTKEPPLLDQTLNTLGCGDAFMAGYISSYRAGKSMEACSNTAHACAQVVALSSQQRLSEALPS